MKSMTYAQKADLVAKCKRVFESVKRSNQVAMAESYNDLAVKCIGGEYQLASNLRLWASEMHSRIKNKPRYRYDSKAGEWVTIDEYLTREYCRGNKKAINQKLDFMKSEFEFKRAVAEREAMIQSDRIQHYLDAQQSYAAQQRRGVQNTFGGQNPFHPHGIGQGALGGFY